MGTRLDSVLVVDYRRSLDGIPEEVVSLLPLFDGVRSAREALKRARVPEAHAPALLDRLRRLGVLAESVEYPEGPELSEWLRRPKAFPRWWIGAAAALAVAVIGALTLRPSAPSPVVVAPPAPVVVAPAAPVVVAPPAPVVVAPPAPEVAPAVADEYPRLIRDARSLLDRGAYHKALAAANQASQARPDSAEPYLVIGTVEQQNGRIAQASAAYKRYLALAPKGAYASEIRSILRTLR